MRQNTTRANMTLTALVLLYALGLASCGYVPVSTSTYSTVSAPPPVGSGSGGGGAGTTDAVAGGGGGVGTAVSPPAVQKGPVVQLFASSLLEHAEQIKAQFVQDGYPAFTSRVLRNGEALYRVQIGPYASRQGAELVLQNMKQRYHSSAMVKQAFVNENK